MMKKMENALDKHSYDHVEFSIEIIQQATDNFNENNILGKEGFGVVYKGKRQDCRTSIAVKRVKVTTVVGSRRIELRIQHYVVGLNVSVKDCLLTTVVQVV